MVINQHFIPRFYQQYWECERKGYLWALDKKYSRQGVRQHSIRNNCSDEYTYEADVQNPDNAIENWYGKFETRFAPKYLRLINSRFCLQRISTDYKRMLCLVYAHFSARNKVNVYANVQNQIIASHFTLGFEDKLIDNRAMLNIVALMEGDAIEGTEGNSNFANELMTYKMQILVSDKTNIIFSDSIIRQVHCDDEYFFPLCPTMVVQFTKADNAMDGSIRKITDEEYTRFIEMYLNSSYVEQIYSSDKSTLERINQSYHFYMIDIKKLFT